MKLLAIFTYALSTVTNHIMLRKQFLNPYQSPLIMPQDLSLG
jgi:hypothetical protein